MVKVAVGQQQRHWLHIRPHQFAGHAFGGIEANDTLFSLKQVTVGCQVASRKDAR